MMSTNGELYVGDIEGERPRGSHGGALSVNTGTERNYDDHDLTPPDNEDIESFGRVIERLEQDIDGQHRSASDVYDSLTTMYNQG